MGINQFRSYRSGVRGGAGHATDRVAILRDALPSDQGPGTDRRGEKAKMEMQFISAEQVLKVSTR